MKPYLIITSVFHYGQSLHPCEKNEVRSICENARKMIEAGNENTYKRIEVVNTETGQIVEYWNNHENTIKF